MKSLLSVALVSLFSVGFSAQADGFVCENLDSTLSVKVYNHVKADEGTRNVAVMVLTDPQLQVGNRTIAVLRAPKTLRSDRLTFSGRVDLRFSESSRKGELILGTKLGELKTVALTTDFSYALPLMHGEELDATLKLTKRNGDVIKEEMICNRYLKN